jgi:hypothetical protein
MRTKLRSRITLLFIVCALLIAIPAVAAIADNVQNDVIAGGNYTITTASSTTINYRITANSGDGEAGCNATPASPATLNINAPSGVTATPASRTFTSCGTNQSVQFSANAAGDYVINVSVSDTGAGTYNTNPARFTLHVTNPPPPPNTPPTLTLPGPQTVQATGPNGAVVTYNATANDAQDGPLTPTCTKGDPPVAVSSGDTFPLGITQVNCSVTDSGGASATGFFDVTVVDTTAPSIAPHDNVTAEATSADGAVVNYTNPTASDLVDGSVNVNCSPASGSQFPIATTTVNCSATDAHGNTAHSTFNVTVEDTTGPVLNLPDDITEEATGPNGNVVNYNATASDQVDGDVNVDCTPASGSQFPIATTTVNCSATDAAGNTANGTFTVTVQDTLAPTDIQFVGNINDGDSFFFGEVPAKPTCTATDGGSGLDSCVVSGYSTAVGTHTLKATAKDKVGNTSTKEIIYTVKPYTLKGFYQPVDMGDVLNTVKNGSTVPVKFELFKGTTELTSTSAVFSILAKTVSCAAFTGDPEDAIETVATGGTSLRYDATGGQFIYNWQTPKKPNTCYNLTMTATDGSTITAYFKLK